MYSMMMVESKIRVSPSISTGTSARGLAAANGPSVRPVPKLSGSSAVKATPFSRRAIFTFWAYDESGCSYSNMSGFRAGAR